MHGICLSCCSDTGVVQFGQQRPGHPACSPTQPSPPLAILTRQGRRGQGHCPHLHLPKGGEINVHVSIVLCSEAEAAAAAGVKVGHCNWHSQQAVGCKINRQSIVTICQTADLGKAGCAGLPARLLCAAAHRPARPGAETGSAGCAAAPPPAPSTPAHVPPIDFQRSFDIVGAPNISRAHQMGGRQTCRVHLAERFALIRAYL